MTTKKVNNEELLVSKSILCRVTELLTAFELELESGELRAKVLALIPIFTTLRHLGKSLFPTDISSARNRILYYFQQYPGVIISGDELLVVSGIQEYARRLRELRVEFGWSIVNGVTLKEIQEADDDDIPENYRNVRPDEYVMLDSVLDRDAAHRWHVANTIRKKDSSVRSKIIEYMRQNIGLRINGEELRYVAGDRTEWARRTRELRNECGWPITTKSTGRPDLPIGIYVLEADRQSPLHDRNIPDDVRGRVLRRDDYTCQVCDWTHSLWNLSDPRHLELHHIEHHAKGGNNTEENLQTLCNICHDVHHKNEME